MALLIVSILHPNPLPLSPSPWICPSETLGGGDMIRVSQKLCPHCKIPIVPDGSSTHTRWGWSSGDPQGLVEEGQPLVHHQRRALAQHSVHEVGASPGVHHAVEEALQRHTHCLEIENLPISGRTPRWENDIFFYKYILGWGRDWKDCVVVFWSMTSEKTWLLVKVLWERIV